MASTETIRRLIYDVPSEEAIELLTSYRVLVNAVGADGYTAEESKRIVIRENQLQSKEDLMNATNRVRRNIHELVCLTKDARNWWLYDSREACKIFWRIDHFLNIERSRGFGVVDKRKLEDYQALGTVAQKMLEIMAHRETIISKDSFTLNPEPKVDENQRALDSLMHGLDMVTVNEEHTIPDDRPLYKNPFASELSTANINLHDIFRI